jgi:uncharacterized membrane protein
MIEAHTMDAWTRAADKKTIWFGSFGILGGFAAPLFLWLAGVALVLSATRIADRQGSRTAAVDAICRRGLEIFILAFLFRLQAFIVSPGSHPVTLFRVDILNVMGPSIVAAAIVWRLAATTTRAVLSYGLLTVAVAMLTPIVRTIGAIDTLPVWIQWYLRPSGEHTTFTAFPWAGFVFAGAACGALIADARDIDRERRLHRALAMAGVALVALGWYTSTRPSIYRDSFFWTSSPTWFAIRIGLMMVALSAMGAIERFAGAYDVRCGPFACFGRSSLFVYWIHVELVYGYASWLWRGRLPLWASVAAWVAFSGLMYASVVARDRIADAWRARDKRPVPQVATA